MKTVAQLKAEIIAQLWPSGAPENLATIPAGGTKSPFDMSFDEAFGEICKWVDGEQQNHTDIIPFCATWYHCGTTVIAKPIGILRRVGTILTGNYCSPVWYRWVEWPAPEWLGLKLAADYGTLITAPDATLALGYAKSAAGTDTDYRAESGLFAVHRKNIVLAPWIQSVESIVLEWDGIKRTWADTDLVTDTEDYRKCVKLYFEYLYEYHYGSKATAATIHNPAKTGTFDEALADYMWQDRENTRQRIIPLDPDTRNYLVPQTATEATAGTDGSAYLTLTDTVTGLTYRVTVDDGQVAITQQ